MDSYYGMLDLTKLGEIVRKDPQAVKMVTFKDGSVHKMVDLAVNAKQQPDKFGNVAYVKVSVRQSDQKQGVNYYLGDLKQSKFSNQNGPQQQSPTHQAQKSEENSDDLPF